MATRWLHPLGHALPLLGRTPGRPLKAATLLVGLVALAGCGSSAPMAPAPPWPTSMAAVGDSITQAYDSCGTLQDCPDNSWATGSASAVDSHATRLLKHAPGLQARTYDDASTGATSADLAAQVDVAVGQQVDYLTVLVGANDVCQPTLDAMTPADIVGTRVHDALVRFTAARPAAHVLLASVPDVRRLWEVGHEDAHARLVWSLAGICPTALGEPSSMTAEATARRDAVHARVVAINAALQQACAGLPTCRWDGGAVFNARFSLDQLSEVDDFHPSVAGQRHLASVTWKAGWWR